MDRPVLVAAAALAVIAVPAASAQAQRWSDPNFGAAAGVTVHRGAHHHFKGDFVSADRDGRRHHRGSSDSLFAGAWAYGDSIEPNRSWDSDSFNDWWHDRPDRAFPRWVQNNQNCTPDRMWWSGSGWHC